MVTSSPPPSWPRSPSNNIILPPPPSPSPTRRRRDDDLFIREAPYWGRRWGLRVDLRSHEGHLPPQWGLHTATGPASFSPHSATWLMLSAQLRSQVWLCTRSVFVPKKNGRTRPLGIGDTWYCFVGRVALSKVGDRVGSTLSPEQLVGICVMNGASKDRPSDGPVSF